MKRLVVNTLNSFVIAALVLWVVFPFYWAVVNSLKAPVDVHAPGFIPFAQFRVTWQNWRDELFGSTEVLHRIRNSLFIAIGSSLIALVLGAPAGYGLARCRYRWKWLRWENRDILLWFLSQRILPPIVTVIPFILLYAQWGLYDTLWGLTLAHATFTLPFAVLIVRDAFADLPAEMEESALVDGCSPLAAFGRIALPLALPALVAALLICFAFSWNEFLFALKLTQSNALTVPYYIATSEHSQGERFWVVSIRTLIAVLPPGVLGLFAQRYILRGLTLGAVKG
jgi:multiple sugar transport system permease protein